MRTQRSTICGASAVLVRFPSFTTKLQIEWISRHNLRLIKLSTSLVCIDFEDGPAMGLALRLQNIAISLQVEKVTSNLLWLAPRGFPSPQTHWTKTVPSLGYSSSQLPLGTSAVGIPMKAVFSVPSWLCAIFLSIIIRPSDFSTSDGNLGSCSRS
jgi:hypothetical protein